LTLNFRPVCRQAGFELGISPVGIIAASIIMANAGFYQSLDHSVEALNNITEQIVEDVRNGT
jgi:hypothetical protein